MVYRTLYDFYESRVINDPSTATSGTKLSRQLQFVYAEFAAKVSLVRQSDLLFCE